MFFELFLNFFLNCFWIFFWIFQIYFGIFFSFSCFWFVYVAFICPWSAHGQPVIYRASPAKSAKKFVLVNFFRFSKSREKSQKTQRKSGFLCHFLLIKTAFFLKRSSQKCIIKTIISYTTNAQLFHWKTVRKCLRTNVIHFFFKCFGIFCFDFDKRKLYKYFQFYLDVFLFNFLICWLK